MAAVRRAALALLLSTLAGACGDPLVEGDYGGEPRLILHGQYEGPPPAVGMSDPAVRGAIFWSPGGTAPFASLEQLVEQPATGRPFRIPGRMDWPIFELPGAEHLASAAGGAPFGLGLPFLYLDGDGDRRRAQDEPMIVHAPGTALLFAPQALAATDSPTGTAIPAGYHLISTPFPCAPAPPPVAEGECGVPVGAPCRADADCGAAGVCLQDGPTWRVPGGMCVIPEPPPAGCRPRGGALVPSFRDQGQAFWFQACRAETDCQRGPPYVCDVAFGACLPTGHVRFVGEPAPAPTALCTPAG